MNFTGWKHMWGITTEGSCGKKRLHEGIACERAERKTNAGTQEGEYDGGVLGERHVALWGTTQTHDARNVEVVGKVVHTPRETS